MMEKRLTPEISPIKFEAVVTEAKKRIPAYIDGWTEHNASDPGVTLIELFAWMTEMIAYQQNRIPERLHLRLLKMMGIEPNPPEAAKTAVTFYLSTPLFNRLEKHRTQDPSQTIPAGTAVATTQTETEASIIFATAKSLKIEPPLLQKVLFLEKGEQEKWSEREIPELWQGNVDEQLFSTVPRPNDAIYFGFDNDISQHLLLFNLQLAESRGVGIDETYPPYVWEAAKVARGKVVWQSCEVDFGDDETKGLNQSGRILLHLPPQLSDIQHEKDGSNEKRYWVRLRVLSREEYPHPNTRAYTQSPRLTQLRVGSLGGAVEAVHSQTIEREFLGYSDGSPGQRFQLQSFPLLELKKGEVLLVQPPLLPNAQKKMPEEEWRWQKNGFGNSQRGDRHFTLNLLTGQIQLPPAIPQPNGAVKLFGDIPPRDATLWFSQYRAGGGTEGNVAAKQINTLKTAIPYVNKVRNRQSATNGKAAQKVEEALLTAPSKLHAQQRAVTAADFEHLAQQVPGVAVGRAKCLQPTPSSSEMGAGQLFVLVLPKVEEAFGQMQPDRLHFHTEELKKIRQFLDERRLLTTRLEVAAPELVTVEVHVDLRLALGGNRYVVEQAAKRRLEQFINPLEGGLDNKGWPFNKPLYPYDVYHCLQGLPDVLNIEKVTLHLRRANGRLQIQRQKIALPPNGVFISGRHKINFVHT